MPIVRQSEASECGIACLAMIAGYHGVPLPQNCRLTNPTLRLDGLALVELSGLPKRNCR